MILFRLCQFFSIVGEELASEERLGRQYYLKIITKGAIKPASGIGCIIIAQGFMFFTVPTHVQNLQPFYSGVL